MSRIIILSNPGEGHFNPFVPILKELIERRHEVVCMAGKKFGPQLVSSGARFHPYPGKWDHSEGRLYELFPGMKTLTGIAQVKYYLCHVRYDPIPDIVRTLQDLLARFPADVLIYDSAEPAGLMLHELGGPPAIGVSVLPLPPIPERDRDHAPFGFGLLPGTSFFAKARNRFLSAVVKEFLFKDVNKYANEVRSRIGLPPQVDPLLNSYLNPDLFLHMSIRGFEYPRAEYPENLRFIGTVLLSKKAGYIKPAWWPDLESDLPVVLINQGTVNKSVTNLIQPAIEALRDENVLVVAVPVEPGTLGNLPKNTRTEPYIPFGDLLPHVDIMITNGGFGGTQNALAHGIPIIISGKTEDKMEVAARVKFSGAGINLRKEAPCASVIRKAVRKILADSSYKDRAKCLQSEYAKYNPARLTADYAEALIQDKKRPVKS